MNPRLPRWTPIALIILAGSANALAASPFPASINLSSVINGTDGFVLNGIDAIDQSGFSVSSAGDVNGDGVDDVIIGANSASPGGTTYAGESYVVFGGAGVGAGGSIELSSLDGTNGFVLNGIGYHDFSGKSVSSAGDVNGDGFDDLIIGAQDADPGGESFVVFGDAGVGGSLDLSTLDGTNGFVLNGIGSSDFSGSSVSSAGDVNGDGFDDIIIGAPVPYGPGSGESYVVFGAANVGVGGSIELSALDGTLGFTLNGIDAYSRTGHSVSSAGDVNADGIDDLIIGAPGAYPGGVNSAGESYVVFGGAGLGASGALDLSTLNGTNGFVLNGIDVYGRTGHSVSSAGDVNADGIDDLIIGGFPASESYVIFGKDTATLGNFPASFDPSSLDGTNGFVLNGIDAYSWTVSSAGDMNGDGVDDLIIGAPVADPGGVFRAGESYVVFGGAEVGVGGSLDLATLNGTNGFVLNGIDVDDWSGYSVSCAGDVNADGADDLIIGASNADPGGVDRAGESYVVFGRSVPMPTPCVGDIDGDGDTDVFDFGTLAGSFGNTIPPGTFGDLDGSGFVDVLDFAIFAPDFGCTN